MKRKSRSVAGFALIGLVAICCVLAMRRDKDHMRNEPVLFYPVSKSTNAISLHSQESIVIRELALAIKQRGSDVSKQDVFTLASIGYFKIGEDEFEWNRNLLFTWDDSIDAYLVLKDARLGKCFSLLQSKHVPFDPAEITVLEWQDALHNLALH